MTDAGSAPELVVKSNKGLAETVFVQQVQAISPRAARVVKPVSTPSHPSLQDAPLHESFKDAKIFWLQLVMVGLLLLGASSALAIIGARQDAEDAVLTKLKCGFVAGPGGPKLWILNDMIKNPATRSWSMASLVVYTVGVLAVMWPERVGIMGLAGIGRLIACVMAVAGLIFGIDLIRDEARLLKVDYDELLTWLIFLDMAAMILVNMRIAGIAGRGGYHGLAKLTGGMMTIQVSSILMLLFTLNVSHKGMGLMWASSGTFAAGGVGVGIVGLFLVIRIWWEMMRRGINKSRDENRTAADDWDDPSK